jgi:hypothetical protein
MSLQRVNRDFPESEIGGRRREKVRADIALRIGRVCPHLSEKDLADLVDLMTDRQLRGERRDSTA